jgi:hypothetical protein
MLHWVWLDLTRWAGKVANLAGIPGIVREGKYESAAVSIAVEVRRGEFHTVITVNGMDLYFHRMTGSLTGVSSNDASYGPVARKASVETILEHY